MNNKTDGQAWPVACRPDKMLLLAEPSRCNMTIKAGYPSRGKNTGSLVMVRANPSSFYQTLIHEMAQYSFYVVGQIWTWMFTSAWVCAVGLSEYEHKPNV